MCTTMFRAFAGCCAQWDILLEKIIGADTKDLSETSKHSRTRANIATTLKGGQCRRDAMVDRIARVLFCTFSW